MSDKELNLVYASSLRFGKNWRRPVAELAAERLPGRPPEFHEAVAEVVSSCRSEIELNVAQEHARLSGRWRRSDRAAVATWLSERFPWMSRANRSHAVGQGMYYAHHDGW